MYSRLKPFFMEKPEYELVGVTRDLSVGHELKTDVDFLELQTEKAENLIEQISNYAGSIPLIVSYRYLDSESLDEGQNYLDYLLQASRYGCVDKVELELWVVRENEWIIDELRQNEVDIIVSYNNLEETPPKSDLQQIIEECSKFGDIAKVSAFANSRGDCLTLLNCLNSASESGLTVAGYSLGKTGQHTRVISIFYGSKFCYGHITIDEEGKKQGQIELDQLTDLIEMSVHGGDHVELMDILRGKFS